MWVPAARPSYPAARPTRTTSPAPSDHSRSVGDIPKAESPATHCASRCPLGLSLLQHLQSQVRLAPILPSRLRHPRRHAPLHIPSPFPPAGTAACPPIPVPWAPHGPETPQPGSWQSCPTSHSTAGPLPPTSRPAWENRCRPAPTPLPGAPTGDPDTPATGQSPGHHPRAIR